MDSQKKQGKGRKRKHNVKFNPDPHTKLRWGSNAPQSCLLTNKEQQNKKKEVLQSMNPNLLA